MMLTTLTMMMMLTLMKEWRGWDFGERRIDFSLNAAAALLPALNTAPQTIIIIIIIIINIIIIIILYSSSWLYEQTNTHFCLLWIYTGENSFQWTHCDQKQKCSIRPSWLENGDVPQWTKVSCGRVNWNYESNAKHSEAWKTFARIVYILRHI